MKRPLSGPTGDYEIVPPEEESAPDFEPVPKSDVGRILAALAGDPSNRAVIRQLAGEGRESLTPFSVDRDAVKRLCFQIERGRFRLMRRTERPLDFPPDAPAEPEEAPAEVPTEQKRLRKLCIRIAVDPSAATSKDDIFVLRSTDDSYNQQKSVADDKTPGDKYVDLIYTDIDEELVYTLEHYTDPAAAPRFIFKEKRFWDIAGVSRGKAPRKKRAGGKK